MMSHRAMYTILIVDDDPKNLFSLRALLESELDVQILEAISGLAALEKISQHKVDLILLDIQMPDLNGFEVAKLIRNRGRYQHIPIIFLTAVYKSEEFKYRGLEGGGIDYLTKPLDDLIFINRIKAYLRVIEDERALNLELEEINSQLHAEIEERNRIEGLLRRSEEQLELFFSESLDGCLFMMLDEPVQWDETVEKDQILEYVFTHQRVTKANEALLYQYRTTYHQFIGYTPAEFFAHDLSYGKRVWRQLFDQGRLYIETDQRTFDEMQIWIEGNYICLYDKQGRIQGHFGIQRDITDRKHAEQALKELNEQLEQRVNERTAELKHANIALKESLDTLQHAQDQLIQSEKMAALGGLVAGVSHEISTPLGLGVTASSHLHDLSLNIQQTVQDGKLTRAELTTYLEQAITSAEIIGRNLKRASEQMQGFKQIAVDQASGEQRTFFVKTYFEEIIQNLRPKLKRTRHNVQIRCPEQLRIHSYPGAFSQILTNLIMNSLIHGFETETQGEITIDVSQEAESLHLCYHDNGKGIPPEALSKIFNPFYTTRREQGGSGLGLNIIQNLVVNQLKGTIECQSEPSEGTTFLLHFPQSPDDITKDQEEDYG